jgi:3-oxoisoapionate kinase
MAILYSFYGDDFTGSTDVLQQLASAGVPAVLFLHVPSADELARFPGVTALGVAGDSRSRTPAWMEEHLPGVFRAMRAWGAPVNHYKVCSTFDSSADAGSIGRAIELGREVFAQGACVPIVVAAPHLRRYVCFGSLFAAGPDGEVARLDRHPMSRHPVTPMLEADLRRHLEAQTSLPVALVDLPRVLNGGAAPEVMGERSPVLFDGVDERTQKVTGDWVWGAAQTAPMFAVGSSGLTAALVDAWRTAGLIHDSESDVAGLSQPATSTGEPLLVVSGSCSLATGRQIEWALRNGFSGIRLEPASLEVQLPGVVEETVEALLAGRSTVVYTALGASTTSAAGGEALGRGLGDLVAAVLRRVRLRRILLCGGDTCSHAVQQLPIGALTWLANACPGGPLCRAHSENTELDGLELVLKGGQVGEADLFATVARM